MDSNLNNTVDNKLNAVRDGATQINKDLRADAHTAIDRAADKVPPATDRLATRAHNGVDAVADTVDGVSTSVVARGKQLGAAVGGRRDFVCRPVDGRVGIGAQVLVDLCGAVAYGVEFVVDCVVEVAVHDCFLLGVIKQIARRTLKPRRPAHSAVPNQTLSALTHGGAAR